MKTVEDEKYLAKNGDLLIINFQGTLEDGTQPENMKGENFSLTLGSGSFIPGFEGFSFYARVDEEALQKVAEATGAEFFRATNASDLATIYQHLSSKFTLERRDTEISALWAALSLVLLLCAGGLSLVWFRRQPWGQA